MEQEKNKNKSLGAAGRIMLVATAVFWGLAGVCVKNITWGTMPTVCARSLISVIMLFIAKWLTDYFSAPSGERRLAASLGNAVKLKLTLPNIFGAAAMSATGILYVQSIKLTTAGTAIVLQYIAPILVFLFAVLFQHKKAKPAEIFITLAVFSGIVFSFSDQLDPTHIVGNIFGLLSGFTFAAQIIIMNRKGTDSLDSLIISCIMSFIITLPFMFTDSTVVFNLQNIVWVLVLAVFQYGAANILFGFGIQLVDKIEASLILTIEPIFNPIPVALLGIEMMGRNAIIGSAIVIVFVAIYGMLPYLSTTFPPKKKKGK